MPKNSSVFFISGGLTPLSQNLAVFLAARGDTVKIITEKDVRLPAAIQQFFGHYEDPEIFSQAVKGADVIIHCAAGSIEESDRTKTILSLAKKIRKRIKFLLVSSIEASGRNNLEDYQQPINEFSPNQPSSDLGISLANAELAVKSSDLIYSIIKSAFIVEQETKKPLLPLPFLNSLATKLNWPGEVSIIKEYDLYRGIIKIATDARALNEVYICGGDVVTAGQLLSEVYSPSMNAPRFLFKIAKCCPPLLPHSLIPLLFPFWKASSQKLYSIGWRPGNQQ